MKTINHYSPTTSAYELFTHLYERIIKREITTFSGLMEYTKPIPLDNPKSKAVLLKAFKLIQELHWGFFKDLDPAAYPKLWKQIVITNPYYKQTGDIKRNMTIAEIYVGMMDIHGYTKFCQENRRNLSMLQMLDDCIQSDIRDISKKNNVISQRARGDEIILVGTTASDILATTLSIIDYFSKRRVIKNDLLSQQRSGSKIILPDMKVSAGIAGGRTYTSLIITKDGDISGSVVNTASRLQSYSNKTSPSSSKLLVTKHVYLKFLKETSAARIAAFKDGNIQFFDAGSIQFKGIEVPLYEVLFRESEKMKLHFQKEMAILYDALKRGQWKEKVFIALTHLLKKVCESIPKFRVSVSSIAADSRLFANQDVIALCRKAIRLIIDRQDYSEAINTLHDIANIMEAVPAFDGTVNEYAKSIVQKYELIKNKYNREIETNINTNMDRLLSPADLEIYKKVEKSYHLYMKFRQTTRKNDTINNHKSIWYRIIDSNEELLQIQITSSKD